jgi:RNA-directed DNA polymerase
MQTIERLVAVNMSKTEQKTTVEWRQLDWRKLEQRVFKLQTRIYQARQRGDIKTVRKLQKTLSNSWSAKCLAVRRVSQDNQGKKTAGIDGVKSLSPDQRLAMVARLKFTDKSRPVRRVWIPKPGSEEQRPLGIPTLYDRALQTLAKMALEPEWESQFEVNSYGFRPGRSCQDAIKAIRSSLHSKTKYVLDADISGCFDNINQAALLTKLNTYPTLQRQIKAWLEAGVVAKEQLFPTTSGTPQGGAILPLLANIALHGMELLLNEQFPEMTAGSRETWFHPKGTRFRTPRIIRYADDFVVIHENLAVIQNCQELLVNWLSEIGLTLKPSKTRIVHTLEHHDGQAPGFDFLGFTIRQFPVGQHRSGFTARGEQLGFVTLITPSKIAQKRHQAEISRIIETNQNVSQEILIFNLLPVIRGWTRYYSTENSKQVFHRQNFLTFQKLWRWAKRRHPNKSKGWVARKYWTPRGRQRWCFTTGLSNLVLPLHSMTAIQPHVKVRGAKSPYDGDWVYWSIRMGKYLTVSQPVATLLKKQKGRCSICELYFTDNDRMEIDHMIPLSLGGSRSYSNLQLLHRHCHDRKTASDGSSGAFKGCITEEPDEVKVSRPVLKPSLKSDLQA